MSYSAHLQRLLDTHAEATATATPQVPPAKKRKIVGDPDEAVPVEDYGEDTYVEDEPDPASSSDEYHVESEETDTESEADVDDKDKETEVEETAR